MEKWVPNEKARARLIDQSKSENGWMVSHDGCRREERMMRFAGQDEHRGKRRKVISMPKQFCLSVTSHNCHNPSTRHKNWG